MPRRTIADNAELGATKEQVQGTQDREWADSNRSANRHTEAGGRYGQRQRWGCCL